MFDAIMELGALGIKFAIYGLALVVIWTLLSFGLHFIGFGILGGLLWMWYSL